MLTLLNALLLAIVSGSPQDQGAVGANEGPVWDGKGALYFVGRNRISRRDSSGVVSIYRESSGGANGLLFDAQGRLVACEAASRRVTRTEPDGKVTVLADSYEGKKFNSPNDLTVDSKGRIYFSDPRYGKRDGMEMQFEGVYRIDAPGKVTRVIGPEVERANGVLVSPGDTYLYVADNNNNKVGGARKLWRFRLRPDGSVEAASRKLIFDWQDGRGPDGLKMDSQGNLFVAAGRTKAAPPYESADKFPGGVYVISPEGQQLEFIPIATDEVTNCAFGGSDGRTLFVTAGGNLWTVPVKATGSRRKP